MKTPQNQFEVRKPNWQQMLVGFLFPVLLIGCNAKVTFDKNDSDGGNANIMATTVTSTTSPGNHDCILVGTDCYLEVFKPAAVSTQKVDLLFVVDTSGSMDQERAAIVAGIKNYLKCLNEGCDINIGVMLAHGSHSSWAGRMYRAGNEPLVLKGKELSLANIESYMNSKLTNIIDDIDSDGGEEGIFSLFRGIMTPELLNESKQAGMFRADAGLNVVFVSDENDICAVYPAGVARVEDPDGREEPARVNDCEGLTAQGLTAQLRNLKGSQALVVAGMIYTKNPVPTGSENEIGYGYTDMISLNNGIAIDLRSDLAKELGKLGDFCTGQVLQKEFLLSHVGAIAQTVKVTVDDKDVSFRLEGNKVIVTGDIPAGGVVRILYCVAKVPGGCNCECQSQNHHQHSCGRRHSHCHHHHGHGQGHQHHGNGNGYGHGCENDQPVSGQGGSATGGPVLQPSPEIGQ